MPRWSLVSHADTRPEHRADPPITRCLPGRRHVVIEAKRYGPTRLTTDAGNKGCVRYCTEGGNAEQDRQIGEPVESLADPLPGFSDRSVADDDLVRELGNELLAYHFGLHTAWWHHESPQANPAIRSPSGQRPAYSTDAEVPVEYAEDDDRGKHHDHCDGHN